ncbi:DUF1598 domain-containing protein [Blastopirellula sp. JC732]|uniref:DUF1598 domain-containing protein n=1 Tax=Blastopirellula sediminis TaxID=2894196 RepID=A0A9X1SI39_9BACT|nr:DUF1598 domain-containing protein [Blastopirellula sediminis]MCC9609474.1 DUF1598 domain-containing protein [Blastopirellula sediminis]MCC9627749.1 DUF1598 domain-containing protein [Blastopirellula sediminis]
MSRLVRLVSLAVLLTLLVCVSGARAAGPDPAMADFDALLAAGEFPPAIELAKQAKTAEQQDQMFARLARAQAAGGAKQAALSSARSISSDQYRTETLIGLEKPLTTRPGAMGGGVEPDFDQLIDLITTTIQPESWEELGGPGAIAPFESGVYVDSKGTLQRAQLQDRSGRLEMLRTSTSSDSGNRRVSVSSPLRKVSLNRLEREVHLRMAAGEPLDDEMIRLAGIYKVKYVMVYPATGDVVIAGPAGGWTPNAEGRIVNVETQRPTLRLDDLVVVMRNAEREKGRYGCSITPYQERLAATQDFLKKSGEKSLSPRQRDKWLDDLRQTLGKQEIEVYGVDPDTHVARILVEADYHMKRIGMGLEDGTLGVPSYLSSIKVEPGQAPPPMDVLRWWFALNYSAIATTDARDIFELRGPGVQVLSENELLKNDGERVHTGKSTELNEAFAHNFTKHYEELAKKYPVYAELQNVFDLTLVAAVIEKENLAARGDWGQTYFGAEGRYRPERLLVAKEVETIMNHRVIDNKHIIAGVSGGVRVDASEMMKDENFKQDEYGLLDADLKGSVTPKNLAPAGWWWD